MRLRTGDSHEAAHLLKAFWRYFDGVAGRVGLLGTATAQAWERLTAAFHQGLNEVGYIEGRNVAVEYRWAEGQYDRLGDMANDLVRHSVSVVAALTTPAALAAKAATTAIPIVFTTIGDPVQTGLVTSLSRPEGNMTGAAYLNVELGPKLLELMHEAMASARSMVLLANPTNPNAGRQREVLQAAARTLGIELHVMEVRNPEELKQAFSELTTVGAGALIVSGDPFFNSQREQIAAWALRHRLPSIFPSGAFPAVGGLMSYGGDASEAYKQAGNYTGRIPGRRGDRVGVERTSVLARNGHPVDLTRYQSVKSTDLDHSIGHSRLGV